MVSKLSNKSIKKLQEILYKINPDIDGETWWEIETLIHKLSAGEDWGLELFDEWSKGGYSYNKRALLANWSYCNDKKCKKDIAWLNGIASNFAVNVAGAQARRQRREVLVLDKSYRERKLLSPSMFKSKGVEEFVLSREEAGSDEKYYKANRIVISLNDSKGTVVGEQVIQSYLDPGKKFSPGSQAKGSIHRFNFGGDNYFGGAILCEGIADASSLGKLFGGEIVCYFSSGYVEAALKTCEEAGIKIGAFALDRDPAGVRAASKIPNGIEVIYPSASDDSEPSGSMGYYINGKSYKDFNDLEVLVVSGGDMWGGGTEGKHWKKATNLDKPVLIKVPAEDKKTAVAKSDGIEWCLDGRDISADLTDNYILSKWQVRKQMIVGNTVRTPLVVNGCLNYKGMIKRVFGTGKFSNTTTVSDETPEEDTYMIFEYTEPRTFRKTRSLVGAMNLLRANPTDVGKIIKGLELYNISESSQKSNVVTYMNALVGEMGGSGNSEMVHMSYEIAGYLRGKKEYILGTTRYKKGGKEEFPIFDFGVPREVNVTRATMLDPDYNFDLKHYNESISELYKDSPAYQFVMGLVLGTPAYTKFVPRTGRGGTINLLSTTSGEGKTSAVKTALYQFGDAEQMWKACKNGTTNLSFQEFQSKYNSLPVLLDEVSNMPETQIGDFIHSNAQCKGKSRLRPDGKHGAGGMWEWGCFCITTSNRSLYDRMRQLSDDPNQGEDARLLEIDIPEGEFKLPINDRLEYLNAEVRGSRGYTGRILVEALLNDEEKYKALWDRCFRELTVGMDIDKHSNERFIWYILTCAVFGVKAGEQLGLLPFEYERTLNFCRNWLLKNRQERNDMQASDGEYPYLYGLINTFSKHTLFVYDPIDLGSVDLDALQRHNERIDEVYIRMDKPDGRMAITSKGVAEYCRRTGIERRLVIQDIRNLVPGIKTSPVRIGANSDLQWLKDLPPVSAWVIPIPSGYADVVIDREVSKANKIHDGVPLPSPPDPKDPNDNGPKGGAPAPKVNDYFFPGQNDVVNTEPKSAAEDDCDIPFPGELPDDGKGGSSAMPASEWSEKIETLTVDLETFSGVSLKNADYDTYVNDPNFKVLLLGYSINGMPARVIDIDNGEEIPDKIREALLNRKVVKRAFNLDFDLTCLKKIVKVTEEGWRDDLALSRLAGYSGGLDRVCKALKIKGKAKAKEGVDLIKLFSVPSTKTGWRHTAKDLPKEWEQFKEYCKQDVDITVELEKALSYAETEPELEELDRAINKRGIRFDKDMVYKAQEVSLKHREEAEPVVTMLTGISNVNSTKEKSEWLLSLGLSSYEYTPSGSIKTGEQPLCKLLEDPKLTGSDREAVELLIELAPKTTKYDWLVKYFDAHPDRDRVYDMMTLYGAGATGRWSSEGLQLHNMKRLPPGLDIAEFVKDIKTLSYDELKDKYGANLSKYTSGAVRACIIPSEGKKLIISDYAGIEPRVVAWLSGEDWVLDAIRAGEDLYKVMASRMLNKPVDAITKEERQAGKICVLSLNYGSGSAKLKEAMHARGLEITEDEAEFYKSKYRESNNKIVDFWRNCEEAFGQALKNKELEVPVGKVSFGYENSSVYIKLPSGRKSYYVNPRLVWNEEKRSSEIVCDKSGKQSLYGGMLVENITQAVARDILANALLRLSEKDIILHVHDEIVIESEDPDKDKKDVEAVMTVPPAWGKGIPLGCECHIEDRYIK